MPPLITREVAHRLGEIEDRAELETLDVRLRDPASQLRFRRKADVLTRPDGASGRTPGRQTREHDEAALAGAADDGHGGPRR